jgi:hypothetical protein
MIGYLCRILDCIFGKWCISIETQWQWVNAYLYLFSNRAWWCNCATIVSSRAWISFRNLLSIFPPLASIIHLFWQIKVRTKWLSLFLTKWQIKVCTSDYIVQPTLGRWIKWDNFFNVTESYWKQHLNTCMDTKFLSLNLTLYCRLHAPYNQVQRIQFNIK